MSSMIQYLKESTFAVNEVFAKSVNILKNHYFSVAGLCFLLFVTSNLSSMLASYMGEFNIFLSGFMALVFMIFYFGVNLTLFKYIMEIIDKEDGAKLSVSIPSTKELLYFFTAMLIILGVSMVILLIISVVCWPLIYIKKEVSTMASVSLIVSAILTFLFIIRVAFYPFFIMDKHASSFRSIRLSFALTKGNVTKLLLILFCFAILHILQVYFNFAGYTFFSIFLSIINSFLVVPLSSIVITVAYRNMMTAYAGGENPEILKNII
ncbi:Uncharacterised protein [Sphingobacterium spiritivorum]|nr:Uncharacterised protein [Sphingobacterium spiritivorum]